MANIKQIEIQVNSELVKRIKNLEAELEKVRDTNLQQLAELEAAQAENEELKKSLLIEVSVSGSLEAELEKAQGLFREMNREQTDKVFHRITSNGCREMEEERFNQAVNEAIIAAADFAEGLTKKDKEYIRVLEANHRIKSENLALFEKHYKTLQDIAYSKGTAQERMEEIKAYFVEWQ